MTEELLGALARARAVDLTHAVEADIPRLPFQQPVRFETLVDYPQGALVRSFVLDEHQGTHADAPAHFVEGGLTIDRVPPSTLISHAYLLDVRDAVASDPDYRLDPDAVTSFERRCGEEISGGVVVAHTGWSTRWREASSYFGVDGSGRPHFPGFSPAAVELLVRERKVAAIGIDGPSVDGGAASDYPVHRWGLGAGLVFVENLTRLDEIAQPRFAIVIAPIKLAAGSGAPARVFALI